MLGKTEERELGASEKIILGISCFSNFRIEVETKRVRHLANVSLFNFLDFSTFKKAVTLKIVNHHIPHLLHVTLYIKYTSIKKKTIRITFS